MAFIRDDRGARHDNHGSHVVNRKDLEAIAEIMAIQIAAEDTGEPRKRTTRARKSGATAVRKRRAGAARKKR